MMLNNRHIDSQEWMESFVEEALKAHSIVSLQIAKELRLDLFDLPWKKQYLKQALAMLDRLDVFLESSFKIKYFYPIVCDELASLLKKCEMDMSVIQVLSQKYPLNDFRLDLT